MIGKAANIYFAYKFIRLLTQDWKETDAYKLGIIDEKGKSLKKVRDLQTSEEKDAYSIFNRLVFNIKRMINKLPFGQYRIASYAAALFLIKEHTGVTEDELEELLEEAGIPPESLIPDLRESFLVDVNNNMSLGSFKLVNETMIPNTDIIAKHGHTVIVEHQQPIDILFGIPIYKVKHKLSGQNIYVTAEDIKR